MPEGKHPDHHHDDTGPRAPHEQQKPYWQRAHKDWKFWVHRGGARYLCVDAGPVGGAAVAIIFRRLPAPGLETPDSS
jgi:hypothetical protein